MAKTDKRDEAGLHPADAGDARRRAVRRPGLAVRGQVGRLPGRDGRRRRAPSGCGPAASRTRRATSGRSSSRRPGSARARPSSTARSSRSTTAASPTSPCSRRGSRAGELAAEPKPFVYEVFDLLHLDGRSLLDEPLEERRRLLAGVLRPDPRVRLSEHIEGDGIAFFEAARARGLEGIMAKDRRSPYVPGKRTDRWQKVKIRPEQELVVGGWATGTGKAVDLGRAARRRLRGRRAALRRQDRRRVHGRQPGRAARRGRDRSRPTTHRSPTRRPEPRPQRPVAAPRARHPRRVRRLDRRRPRPPGRLQGHRAREGSPQGHPRAPQNLIDARYPLPRLLTCTRVYVYSYV